MENKVLRILLLKIPVMVVEMMLEMKVETEQEMMLEMKVETEQEMMLEIMAVVPLVPLVLLTKSLCQRKERRERRQDELHWRWCRQLPGLDYMKMFFNFYT